MTYVLAAYGVTIATLIGYAIQLLRARKRLRASAQGEPPTHGRDR